jgi:hypothetical protein
MIIQFIKQFAESYRNGRNFGDSRLYIIRMGLRGKFLNNSTYKELLSEYEDILKESNTFRDSNG